MTSVTQFESRLKVMQSALNNKLDSIKENVTKAANADWNEQAQERENDEVLDALGNEIRRELNLVNGALHRIHIGEYEFCDDCGKHINPSRLEILPYTQYCIDCASKRD